MLKKAIIPGFLLLSMLLVGCQEEPEVLVIDASKYAVNDVNINSESEAEIDLLSPLHEEIIESIIEQTEIGRESIAIMLGGNAQELSISLGFPKNIKVERTLIQKIVEDALQNVTQTTNVTLGEVTLNIEKY